MFPQPLLRRRAKDTKGVNFFPTRFLSEPDFALVSLRRACYGLVSSLSIPRVFPLGSSREIACLEIVGLDS